MQPFKLLHIREENPYIEDLLLSRASSRIPQ